MTWCGGLAPVPGTVVIPGDVYLPLVVERRAYKSRRRGSQVARELTASHYYWRQRLGML